MELCKYIDYTNLKMDAREEDIVRLCQEAVDYHFENVCVHPFYVPLASSLLKDTNIGVCSVVGFPLGMNTPKVKAFEAVEALELGADEIDMVINVGALKDKDYDYVTREIEEVRDNLEGKTLKVIIEVSLLTEEEIIKMVEICNKTFVNFIKTSTGFNGDPKVEDVELINKYKEDTLEIKVAGGIDTCEEADEMIKAGVSRIGTSTNILKEDK